MAQVPQPVRIPKTLTSESQADTGAMPANRHRSDPEKAHLNKRSRGATEATSYESSIRLPISLTFGPFTALSGRCFPEKPHLEDAFFPATPHPSHF